MRALLGVIAFSGNRAVNLGDAGRVVDGGIGFQAGRPESVRHVEEYTLDEVHVVRRVGEVGQVVIRKGTVPGVTIQWHRPSLIG